MGSAALWDLNSPARDQTWAMAVRALGLNTGPPRNSWTESSYVPDSYVEAFTPM